MIGFTATAAPGAVRKARTRNSRTSAGSRVPTSPRATSGLPPPQSVSFRLIEDWYDSARDHSAAADPGRQALGRSESLTGTRPRSWRIEVAFVLVAAFGAGVVDAMAGGGGLIQLPALFAAFPDTPHPTLLGTGKLAGLAGTTERGRALHPPRAARLGTACCRPPAGAFVAALVGAWIATGVSAGAIPRAGAACCSRSCSLYTLLHKDLGRDHDRAARVGTAARWPRRARGVIGLYDGFFGPGTGSFLVFLFVRVFGLDFLHASASAKIVNAAANLAAILLFGLTGKIFWLLGLAMAVCNVVGAQVGSHLAIRHGSAFVRAVFIVVVSCLIAKTAWDALALSF